MLLSKVAFQDKAKTFWHPHLSSALREQFSLTMGGTRQLSSEDLRYLHHKHLGGREEVPLNIFENFWEKWYGVIMRKLNEKNCRKLWEKGIIYGFSSAEEINQLLNGKDIGTFIVGFFDDVNLSIYFVDDKRLISIYYVKEKELKPFWTYLDAAKHLKAGIQRNNGYGKLVLKADMIYSLLPKKLRKPRDSSS